MVWSTQYSSLTNLEDVLQVRITQFMTCVRMGVFVCDNDIVIIGGDYESIKH
jgi:hypothetical protein